MTALDHGGCIVLMQCLIAGEDAVFSAAYVTPLQAEIVEQLIVERAEMLLLAMRHRCHRPSPGKPSVLVEWIELPEYMGKGGLDNMPERPADAGMEKARHHQSPSKSLMVSSVGR
ncbi:MAG: hypothetical protein R3F54_12730 [Alphaproteobacteria bacterium]